MDAANFDPAPVRRYLQGLQTSLADAIGALDGASFAADAWQRPAGGSLRGEGVTKILE